VALEIMPVDQAVCDSCTVEYEIVLRVLAALERQRDAVFRARCSSSFGLAGED
jgi:hypothetical protein